MRQEPFLALTDISWVTNHFSDITDKHTFCFCLRLLCKDIWSSNLIYNIYGSKHSNVTCQGGGQKIFFFFWLIPTPMVIIITEISIWGVTTTKKPQIWPYFGPKAYNEVNWRIWNIKFNLQLEEHFWVQIPSVIPFRNRLVIPNLEI